MKAKAINNKERTYDGHAITSRDWSGVERVLCHQGTNEPLCINEQVTSFRGERATITGGRAPQHTNSEGKVWTADGGEYFASVFGLHWL